MTLGGVNTALAKLKQNAIPYRRPADFFAEMIKPDSQMAKVASSSWSDFVP